MKTMDASKVRGSFARVLESVRDRQETIVIVRYGQAMAALVPLSVLGPHDRSGPERTPPAPGPAQARRSRRRLPR